MENVSPETFSFLTNFMLVEIGVIGIFAIIIVDLAWRKYLKIIREQDLENYKLKLIIKNLQEEVKNNENK